MRSPLLIMAALFGFLIAGCRAKNDDPRPVGLVHVKTPHHLQDIDGRVLILHGANVDLWAKLDPIHFGDLTDAELSLMSRTLGFNAVRLLLFWSAIEPEKGVFDEAYLTAAVNEVKRYADHGIRVILDLHQDCPPAAFYRPDPGATEYNGAPDWAVKTDAVPYHSTGAQYDDCASESVQHFLKLMFDPATPHPELAEHYNMALAKVADRFKDDPAVIGYDVMNEPLVGVNETLALLFKSMSGHVENTPLTLFTQRLIDTVRAFDKDKYIFVEPSALVANSGGQSDLGQLVDSRMGEPRLVLETHLYDPKFMLNEDADPASHDHFLKQWSGSRTADIERQAMPGFLGEFGTNDPQYLDSLLSMADNLGLSWAQWAWSGHWRVVTDDGHENVFTRNGLEVHLADSLARVYPRAIAGIPESFGYDAASRVFRFSILPKADAKGPTEIFVPAKRHYANGWSLTVDGVETQAAPSFDASTEILLLNLDSKQPHTVCIAPVAAACAVPQ